MKLLIKNGRVLDPANGIDAVMDLFIEDGKITALGHSLTMSADREFDATDLWVTPGLIDLHVHLREPGYEQKETIYDGARSAAAGGFATICCMPNTAPVADNPDIIRYIRDKAEQEAIVRVLPIGAITVGQKGTELTNMEQMAGAGACGFSEDGKTVADALLMKQALMKAKRLNLPVFSHCEDIKLANGGVVNEGTAANRFDLPGISCDSESVIVARDILLSGMSRLHICHISTAAGVDILQTAQNHGMHVTAEACPHHFALCDEDITDDDGNYKMNPPLRSSGDVERVKWALKENIINIIATDHAPHEQSAKNCGLMDSVFGITGLETAVGLCVTELVNTHILTPLQLVEKLTVNPARVLGRDIGTLSVGRSGDVTIIDPKARYTIEPEKFFSKGKNTPFGGRQLMGKAVLTIVEGRIVYDDVNGMK